ncbi:MAG: hypothetical protein NTY80_04005 [candidate division SR1 bacterium]|nr:hypothetical protein [candidate division SR1 bacterium]
MAHKKNTKFILPGRIIYSSKKTVYFSDSGYLIFQDQQGYFSIKHVEIADKEFISFPGTPGDTKGIFIEVIMTKVHLAVRTPKGWAIWNITTSRGGSWEHNGRVFESIEVGKIPTKQKKH